VSQWTLVSTVPRTALGNLAFGISVHPFPYARHSWLYPVDALLEVAFFAKSQQARRISGM
jgi:hypothetical protein